MTNQFAIKVELCVCFLFVFPTRQKTFELKILKQTLFYLGQFSHHAGVGCKKKMTKILQWLLNLNEFLFCVSNKIISFKCTRLIGMYIVRYFSKCTAMHLAVAFSQYLSVLELKSLDFYSLSYSRSFCCSFSFM